MVIVRDDGAVIREQSLAEQCIAGPRVCLTSVETCLVPIKASGESGWFGLVTTDWPRCGLRALPGTVHRRQNFVLLVHWPQASRPRHDLDCRCLRVARERPPMVSRDLRANAFRVGGFDPRLSVVADHLSGSRTALLVFSGRTAGLGAAEEHDERGHLPNGLSRRLI